MATFCQSCGAKTSDGDDGNDLCNECIDRQHERYGGGSQVGADAPLKGRVTAMGQEGEMKAERPMSEPEGAFERARKAMKELMADMPTWSQMFPDGRTIFYEGPDPEGFRQQVIAEFGFDPATNSTWNAERGWQFHCPPEHLDAIYGSNRWQMGS